MANTWWGMALTGLGMLGVGYLGWALTCAIWTGRAPRRIPVSASILVALTAAHILAGQRPGPAATLVASASAAEPACIASPGGASEPWVQGERVTVAGSHRLRSDCAIWAVIIDPRTNRRWVQGPAVVTEHGWSLNLVLGTGEQTSTLRYEVALAAYPMEADQALRRVASPSTPLASGEAQWAAEPLMRSVIVEISEGR